MLPTYESLAHDFAAACRALASEEMRTKLAALVGVTTAPRPRAAKADAPRKAATKRDRIDKPDKPAGAKPRARAGKSAPTECDLASAATRRIPRFVIEATGLDTKRALLERYGPAIFRQGQPLPLPVGSGRNGPVPRPRSPRPPEPDEDQGQRAEG